jgi:hypothetical protein
MELVALGYDLEMYRVSISKNVLDLAEMGWNWN